MLKVTVSEHAGSVVLKLEGRLAGAWVAEVERAWQPVVDSVRGRTVAVDLCDVTFVDAAGKELLTRMHKSGAELSAIGPMTSYIVKRIEAGHNGHKRGTL